MKRRLAIAMIYVLCCAAVAITGAALVFVGWRRFVKDEPLSRQWAVMHRELTDLKHHLSAYKEAHGRYPTNDEGLASLDNFQSRFPVRLYEDPFGPGGYDTVGEPAIPRRRWLDSKEAIGACRTPDGRVPTNAEEFRQTRAGRRASLLERINPDGSAARSVEVDFAVSRGGQLFAVTPAGPICPWGGLYLYENRAGMNPKAFAGSPADDDSEPRYFIGVDKDVYVYSVGALLEADQRRSDRHAAIGVAVAGLILAGLGTVPALLLILRGRRHVWAWCMSGLILPFVAMAGLQTIAVTCYVSVQFALGRDPKLLAAQRRLLRAYRVDGVISDKTHRRALEALDITHVGGAAGASSKPAAGVGRMTERSP